jgi:hypothetical protein
MKIIFLFILALTALLIRAEAQQGISADSFSRLKALPPMGQARLVSNLMKNRLALSDTQYRQVSGIALQLAQQLRPIMDSDDSRWTKLSHARPLLQGTEQQLKTVLTADQYKKYLIFKQTVIDKARATRGS